MGGLYFFCYNAHYFALGNDDPLNFLAVKPFFDYLVRKRHILYRLIIGRAWDGKRVPCFAVNLDSNGLFFVLQEHGVRHRKRFNMD